MIDFSQILTHPFTLGLLVGLFLGFVFLVLALVANWKSKRELRRFQRHLSDKLEVEASSMETMKKDKERLENENEKLRVKIATLSEKPDQKALRELEILARAEKTMTVNAPGFAQAWEGAKTQAFDELTSEDQGKSLPRRIYRRFFGEGGLESLEEPDGEKESSPAETEPSDSESQEEGKPTGESEKGSS
ncbi:MAG: hypothetical protein AAF514_00195 [Verrucomicrobiota bacterium]